MGIRRFTPFLALVLGVAFFSSGAWAGQKAYYHPNADRLFWFMIISDTHIGASGSQPTDFLTWAVTQARQVIAPQFIVNTGDLTDSTNGGTIPNGPHQQEWDTYRQILENAGMNAAFYYDLPGNHDEYNDGTLAYYRANSVQGRATGGTQPFWVRQFPYGRYHFLGACTPANDGAPFSFLPPYYGDHAGLDANELASLQAELAKYPDAELTLIFGHHPFEPGYSSWQDTGLFYGLPGLLNLIEAYGVSFYGFGHTHNYRENFYKQNLTQGIYYMNVASLGESDQNQYAVMAIDGNGLSMVPAQKGIWPVVMITAPVDQCLGACANPYTYEIPQGPNNPIRALVFDPNPVTQVQFAIDGSSLWQDMQRLAGTPIWEGRWNAAAAAPGAHVVTVRAQGSTLISDQVQTIVNPALHLNQALPWLPLFLLNDRVFPPTTYYAHLFFPAPLVRLANAAR